MSASPGIVSFFQPVHITTAHVSRVQSAFPKSDANLFDWAGTIEGASGTVSAPPRRSNRRVDVCHITCANFASVSSSDLRWPRVQNLNLIPP